MHTYQFVMCYRLCMCTRLWAWVWCVRCMFPPTCAALDGSNSGGGARGGVGPSVAHHDTTLLLFLWAAFLYCAHVAVAPHAEAARHGQVQGIHRLRLHLTKHWLTHRLDLPIHLHLAHLWWKWHKHRHTACAHTHTPPDEKDIHRRINVHAWGKIK